MSRSHMNIHMDTHTDRQVDILAEYVETKDADAQTDSSVLTRISVLALIMM